MAFAFAKGMTLLAVSSMLGLGGSAIRVMK
jgi:hypothetical protein